MRINVLATLTFLSFFIGCSTTPQEQGAEKPPKHARRVQVVIYDSTNRLKTSHLDIYDGRPGLPALAGRSRLPQKPYKEIALLTCEGAPKEEAEMTTAILYRARMLGADAVMTVDTAVTQNGGIF